jgi:hypothetical protein
LANIDAEHAGISSAESFAVTIPASITCSWLRRPTLEQLRACPVSLSQDVRPALKTPQPPHFI